MRALLIDAYAKMQVQRVLDYALDPKRVYRPFKDSRIPGDDPRFCTHLGTYRCVFTISEDGHGKLFRQLSISVPSEKLPHVIAAFSIAELFGFTGWDQKSADLPKDWMAHVSTEEHCVVLAQPYQRTEVSV